MPALRRFGRGKRKGFRLHRAWLRLRAVEEGPLFRRHAQGTDSSVAAALLKEGRVSLKGLFSPRTGRTYEADVVLEDTGTPFVKYRLEFAEGRKRK